MFPAKVASAQNFSSPSILASRLACASIVAISVCNISAAIGKETDRKPTRVKIVQKNFSGVSPLGCTCPFGQDLVAVPAAADFIRFDLAFDVYADRTQHIIQLNLA